MNTPGEVSGRGVYLVDTNVFLRFLTNDVPEEADAAEALFRAAEAGRITLYANPLVIAEIVWVLESFYRLERARVTEAALAVATMPGLVLPGQDTVLLALKWYEERGVDYVDAYNAAWCIDRELDGLITLDRRHFARLDAVAARSPREVVG